jgi:MSHA pilin protein MshD
MSARQRRAPHGFTLIDVLLVIAMIGVMAATMTQLAGRMGELSARTVKMRQMLALGQMLLEEVRQMPFTYCDGGVRTATAGSCPAAGGINEGLGPEGGETRYNAANRFDHVSDYNGFAMPGPGCAGLCDMSGALLNPAGSPLSGCNAGVGVVQTAMNGIAAANVMRIRVTVACPGIEPIVVEGIRVRHAPNNF